MERLETITVDEKYFSLVGEGGHAWIYRVDETNVVKILKPNLELSMKSSLERFYRDRLNYEHSITKDAYEKGLSVPEPKGIVKVIFPKDKHIQKGLMLEFIEGHILPEELTNQKLKSLRDSLIGEAHSKGFLPQDIHNENFLWVPKEEKLYVIDLASWSRHSRLGSFNS